MNGNAPEEKSSRVAPQANAASHTASADQNGRRDASPAIPDHELVRKIGQGSYGEVWLGRNVMGTARAVKVVWRHTFAQASHFEREFNGLQKFEPISRSHEGLMDILQIGRDDNAGYFYYVMELADDSNAECGVRNAEPALTHPVGTLSHPMGEGQGEGRSSLDVCHWEFYAPRTLRDDLRHRGALPVGECVAIGLKLASALGHLHEHGLVHRDVKPSNVIFVDGVPKLADIGLVTAIDEAHSMVGTVGYVPPEGPGTPQADLYSVGKVLYELSLGKDRQEFPQLPPDLQAHREYPGLLELNEIILRACATEARQRYHSAQDLFADLALLQSGKSVKRLRLIERRLAVMTKVGSVTSALLVTAAVAYLFAVSQTRQAQTARAVAEQLLYAADMDLAQQALEAGNLVRATSLLEAHRPPPNSALRTSHSALDRDLRGFEWYYFKNLCHGDESQTFRGHQQAVEGVAISPDGKLLATCADDHTIQLWDLVSRSHLAVLGTHAGAVNAIAFSPDGGRLASGGADKAVKIWDVAARTLLAEFTNHSASVTSVAWSPDGKRLAVGTDGATAKLWDLDAGREVHTFEMADRAAELVAVSTDGEWLAIGGNGPVLRLWNLATLKPGPEFYDEAGHVMGIAFSPDSKIVAASRSDGVVLWDIAGHRSLGKLRGHDREIRAVVFSTDGKRMATGSEDTTVRVWDPGSRQGIRLFKGHKDAVSSLAFSPDGRTLFSGSSDGTVKLWDFSRQDESGVLRGHTDAVYGLAFTPDDQLLASAGYDGMVKLWDVRSGARRATLSGHTARVTGVAFALDGRTLVSCSLDQSVRLWNAATGEPLATWPAGNRLSCLAVSPDGCTLACATGWWDDAEAPSKVMFLDLLSRQQLAGDVHVHEMIQTLGFSPEGRTLAVGTVGSSLELLDVASKRSVFASTNLGPVTAWSPRGDRLFTEEGSDMDSVAVLDVAALRVSGHLQIPGGGARSMAVSPDGRTLAVFYTTGRIKLCDIVSGREVATLQGHESFGFGLAFSHDGQTLASGSNDRTIRLWRAPRNEAASMERKPNVPR